METRRVSEGFPRLRAGLKSRDPAENHPMPLRNLTLLLLTIMFSALCWSKAARNHYGATLAEGIAILSEDALEKVKPRDLFEHAMVAITDDFDDYTDYIPPLEFEPLQESLDQEFGG